MSDGKRNALNWFEIPSANFERAKKFYETILDTTMHASNMGEYQMAFFPMDDGKVGGAVINHPMLKPSSDGLIVYLNANPDLTATLDRIAKAGGQILVPKTEITPEIGFFAMFLDSEGNKVALHSQK